MKKVLVIDDAADVREFVSAMLDAAGFAAISAGSGAEGLQLARTQNPDVILCDVRMPEMNGYQVIAALRSDSTTAAIPFIFLSGATERADMRHGMDLGADDYLTKPFKFEELVAAVNSRLKKKAEVQQIAERKLESLRENISFSLPHELLTPLNGILGLSTLLAEDIDKLSPAEIRDYAGKIRESGQRLNRLIENFLTLSKLELIATDTEKCAAFANATPHVPMTWLGEVCQQVAQRHGRAGAVLPLVDNSAVRMEAQYLRKVVEELLDNALKFSPAGTPVRVTGRPAGNQFLLAITDRGSGLTPEQIRQIGPQMQFNRRDQEQQGAGLGLAIARRLIGLSGGRMEIESTPGQGTTVKVFLPLGNVAAA